MINTYEKVKKNSNEEQDLEPSAAEFYIADEVDDDNCLISKEEALPLNCHSVNFDYDELNYFNPEIEARILEFAVKTNRKLLVIYTLISKSAKQRQELIDILESKNGRTWLKNLKNVGSRVWKNSAKIINALITPNFEFNAKMLNKRFDFMTNSVSKLYNLIPEAFQVIFKLNNNYNPFCFKGNFQKKKKYFQFLYAYRNFARIKFCLQKKS